MEIVTKKYKVYEFCELSENAKEAAIKKLADINTDYEWYTSVFGDAEEIGKIMGIDIKKIYFSGFSSQGDGACFEGNYSYVKYSVKRLKEYAPKDDKLHRIVEALAQVQKLNFYNIIANIKHSGHYYHKYCTQICVEDCRGNNVSLSTDDTVSELLRDFMEWIYRSLEVEYEYLSSREAIIETIEINDYRFTEDGEIFEG